MTRTLAATFLTLPLLLSGCGSLLGAHYDIETVDGCMVRIKTTGVLKGGEPETWEFEDDCKVTVNGEEIKQ